MAQCRAASPRTPCCSLTWHQAGRQRLGRGWGGWGAKWVALSGSAPTGDRGVPPSPYPPHIAPAPGAIASLRCPFCHGRLSAPKPPNPAGTRERGRSWRVTPNNSRQKQGTRAQPSPSRRGRRAPVRPPPARLPVEPWGCLAVRPPATCCPSLHSLRAQSHLFP